MTRHDVLPNAETGKAITLGSPDEGTCPMLLPLYWPSMIYENEECACNTFNALGWNVLYTIGAPSEDETATVGARSNEGTFIGTLTVQAREFMWSVQRPSGSRRRLPPVLACCYQNAIQGATATDHTVWKIADHEVVSHP